MASAIPPISPIAAPYPARRKTRFLRASGHAAALALSVSLLVISSNALAQDERTVFFGTADAGVSKGAEWGLDTAWHDENNLRRGAVFMGRENVDIVRVSFTSQYAAVNGELQPGEATDYVNRSLAWVNRWAHPNTTLYINESHPANTHDPALLLPNGQYNPVTWAELIDATTRKYQEGGRTVVSVMPVNEVDLWQRFCTPETHYAILGEALKYPRLDALRLGVSTLNTDVALNPWYNVNRDRLDEGCTHQLAGSFDNYALYFQTVRANGDHASNDELHNVMEAMVGVEYGMQTGIWWGTAELARGDFIKASDGVRLGYAEHRPNWTAASVYRAPDGKVQGFVGESERQALPTTYRFFAKDRDVFYDGHGPRRDFTFTTSGGPGYGTPAHKGTERVVNITWGDDIQPVVDGRYIIVNRNSGKVLEVANGSPDNGANIHQTTYTGAAFQHWDVNPLPYDFGGDYSYYRLRAAHSGKLLEFDNISYSDGANVDQWEQNTVIWQVAWQHCYFEYAGDGWFRIRNRWSGQCLDIASSSTANGGNVVQWTANGGNSQLWRFIPVGPNVQVEFVAPSAPTDLQALANAVSISLSWSASTANDFASYNVYRSASAGGPYDLIARGLVTPAFVDKSANQSRAYHYVVKTSDRALNLSGYSTEVSATPTGAPAVVASYAFEGDAGDATANGNAARLDGSVVFGPGRVGARALALNGSTAFATLPAEVANFDRISISAWVYWTGGGAWQRIFDFGNGTDQYLFLTPNFGGGMRFAIKNGGAEQQLTAPALATNQWVHVAVTLGDSNATLYVNGTSVANSGAITIKPSDFRPAANRIGKGQFDLDPLFAGRVDQFQIHNRVLGAGEVAALMSASATPAADPVLRLPFDATAGTIAADVTGNGWDARLVNAPVWIAGRFDNAVDLPATASQHVALPAGIANGLTDFTASTWVKLDSLSTFTRIFDFGNGTTPGAATGAYLFLTPSNGGAVAFAITASGYLNEQRITGSSTLPVGSWCHVAVTRSGNIGRLYVNGAQVGVNNALTLSPASLGNMTSNYLGRSQYAADPYLDGALDDFRLYARALSASEITALAAVPATQTPRFVAATLTKAAATVAIPYVATLVGDATDADVGDSLTFLKVSGPSWLSLAADGTLGGTAQAADIGENTFTFRATDPRGAFAETSVTIQVNGVRPHFSLRMDETSGGTTIDDSGGGRDATLVNGAPRTVGRLGRAIGFDGTNDHLTLPAGPISTVNDCTVSFWAKIPSIRTWARVFDFGTGTANYMYLTLAAPNGRPRFGIRTGDIGEQFIESSSAFPLNAWAHLAVTLSGTTGTLYLNGVAVGTNTAFTLKPLSLGTTTLNYLGRSQFADPYFFGQLDEFQIHGRALSPSEIADLASPPATPAGLVASAGTSQIGLSWNAVAGATTYRVRRSTVTGGPYTLVADNIAGTTYSDGATASGVTYYYVVTAVKNVAESDSNPLLPVAAALSTPAQAWRQTHFGTTANSGNAADTADPDGDGVTNLLERAFGGNPNLGENNLLPVIDRDQPLLSIVYRKALGASDLVFRVQETTNLTAPWVTATGTQTVVTDNGTVQTIRYTRPAAGAPSLFLRVQISTQ